VTPRRVSVVGTSGSGKSHLAARLATRLAVPHIELDAIHHQPGWTPIADDDFLAAVDAATAGDAWVTCGNYSLVRPIIWRRADTVVVLELPRHVVIRQVVGRTLRRALTREELWNGNRERPRDAFALWDRDRSVIAWSWHTWDVNRTRYRAARSDPVNAHIDFVVLSSRRSIDAWVASLPTA
jgi:adenylate kinase family enzyme